MSTQGFSRSSTVGAQARAADDQRHRIVIRLRHDRRRLQPSSTTMMTSRNARLLARTISYQERLAVVDAALAAAEKERRFGDAQALRLAQQVLRSLIDEQRRLVSGGDRRNDGR